MFGKYWRGVNACIYRRNSKGHVVKPGLDWTCKTWTGLDSFVKHGLDSFVKHGLDSFLKHGLDSFVKHGLAQNYTSQK
jgi:hypothetical protein